MQVKKHSLELFRSQQSEKDNKKIYLPLPFSTINEKYALRYFVIWQVQNLHQLFQQCLSWLHTKEEHYDTNLFSTTGELMLFFFPRVQKVLVNNGTLHATILKYQRC